jgi:hypothetical protein
MTPGEKLAGYVLLVGLLMFALGWLGGYSGLARRARDDWDEFEAGQDALDRAGAPLVEAELALAASLPGPVPGLALAYAPDPERVQIVPGLYDQADFEGQYQATWQYAAERGRWAHHIIEGIWNEITA